MATTTHERLQYDFGRSIGYWIYIASHDYQLKINQSIAPFGITYRQFQVLIWLVYDGELTPAELAQRLMIERPTLTRILDRMERRGWIVRQSDTLDRRSKHVHLLPAAEQVWQQVVECLAKVRAEATRGMTAEEVLQLQSLLTRVRDNLATADSTSFKTTAMIEEK